MSSRGAARRRVRAAATALLLPAALLVGACDPSGSAPPAPPAPPDYYQVTPDPCELLSPWTVRSLIYDTNPRRVEGSHDELFWHSMRCERHDRYGDGGGRRELTVNVRRHKTIRAMSTTGTERAQEHYALRSDDCDRVPAPERGEACVAVRDFMFEINIWHENLVVEVELLWQVVTGQPPPWDPEETPSLVVDDVLARLP